MNKTKIVFLMLVFIIFIISFLIYNNLQTSITTKIKKISEFQITEISGTGQVYKDMEKKNPLSVKEMKYPNELYLKSDSQTSFELFYAGATFKFLPESSLFFQRKIKEFYFYSGEFYWKKELPKKNIEIHISNSDNTLILSEKGRIRVKRDTIEIWNYSGLLKISLAKTISNLQPRQYFLKKKNQKAKILTLLPPPEYISPETNIIQLNERGDSLVNFSWKNVNDAEKYIFKIYSSPLKENNLFDKTISANRISVDLLNFEDFREFFWEVTPFDSDRNIAGIPSEVGFIKMIGTLLPTEKDLKPPKLVIESFTVSGNMIVMRGAADEKSDLFINNQKINIDMEGNFIHTITFKTIGRKNIVFRLISPAQIETKIEKQVTIFEE